MTKITDKPSFIGALRTVDNIPILATVSNLAHIVFKTGEYFFPSQEAQKTKYVHFINDGPLWKFVLRAIPVVGQIFNFTEKMYYFNKVQKTGEMAPTSVNTQELASLYVMNKLVSKSGANIDKSNIERMGKAKFQAIYNFLITKGKYEALKNLICSAPSSFISDDMKKEIDDILSKSVFTEHGPALDNIYEYINRSSSRIPVDKVPELSQEAKKREEEIRNMAEVIFADDPLYSASIPTRVDTYYNPYIDL